MDAVEETPSLPRRQQARNGVCQSVIVGRHHDAARAALHALHVTQHKRRGDAIGLAGASPSHDNGGIGTDELGEALRRVKVYLSLWHKNVSHSHCKGDTLISYLKRPIMFYCPSITLSNSH